MTRQQIINRELGVGDFVKIGHTTTHENPVWEVIDIEYISKISALVTLKLVYGVYHDYLEKKKNVPAKRGPGFVMKRRATQLMKIDIIEKES